MKLDSDGIEINLTAEGVTQRYIALIIKLAWLSPNIMKAIFRGQIPAALSLDKLKKGFPFDWDKQWTFLEFDSTSENHKPNQQNSH